MATILTKGQSYTDPSGNTGTVGFDSATGKPLAEGQTTTIPDTAPATPATPTITADNLAPMTPIKLPEPVPDTTSQEIINGATAGAEVKAETDRLNAEKNKGISEVTKLLGDIGAVEGKQFTYEEQAGASSAKKLADDLQSSIEIESRALKNYTDNLYKNPNLTTTLVNRLATEQERKSASTIADLSIAQQVATRNYDRAVALAEKKVEAELAPIKRDLEAKKFIFDANIDLWNAGEKSILESALQKQEREYEAEKEARTQIENLKIEARKNGAPDSVINKMAQANTVDEALLAAGNYSSDPLDRELKRLQIAKARADLAPNGTDAPTVKTINGVDKQWNPQTQTWEDISGVTGPKDTTTQLDFLATTAQEAIDLSRASGRGTARQAVGKFVKGATKSQQLEQLANTLKTNVLTMSTDPNIKKYFGPQMTEKDVELMTSAGTTLNPDLQTPEQFKAEAERIAEMVARAKKAVEDGKKLEATNAYFDATGTALQVVGSPFYKFTETP